MFIANTGCSGRVVVLAGPPQAGKTTLARTLAAHAGEPYYVMGFEHLYNWIMPPGVEGRPQESYLRALHAAISAMARRGGNVVADYTAFDQAAFEELQGFLAGLEVVWVEVRCPEDVLAARRAQGGGRPEEVAPRPFFDGLPWDLSVDGTRPAQESAAQVLEFVQARPMPGQPRARSVAPWPPVQAPRPGRVALLVGTSSAGKSTLCRSLQAQAGQPFALMGADSQIDFIAPRFMGAPMHPDQMVGFQAPPEGILGYYESPPGTPDNPSQYPHMQIGPVARLSYAMQLRAAAAIARAGVNVVSDQVFLFEDLYREALADLQGLPVLWVWVHADPAVLFQHEKARGDRDPGLSLGILEQMYKSHPWALELDTGKATPAEEAARVLEALKGL